MRGPVFIVSGMPRARTAWIANYLSSWPVHCEHELLSQFKTPEECADHMLKMVEPKNQKFLAYGMSDSGAVLFQDALKKAIPDARWVIVRRSVEECQKSFKNEHGITVDLWEHKRKVDDAIMSLSPLVVDFCDIDARIAEIAEYCTHKSGVIPHVYRAEERLRMLSRFDVKLRHEELVAGAARVAGSGLMKKAERASFTPEMRRFGEIMTGLLSGTPGALQFWNELLEVCDVYDHTVDSDGLDVPKTHRVFKALMLSWPSNPFLQRNFNVLVPVMSAGISAWQYGGRPKSGDIYTEIANTLIFIIYGQAGVDRWMPEIRQLHAKILADDARKDGD